MSQYWSDRATWVAGLTALAALASGCARAQSVPSAANPAAPYGPPINDENILFHAQFDQLEERFDGESNGLRWDGEAWAGTDENRLWLKSEGFASSGYTRDGQDEAYYDRPITTFFDLQAGIRYDLDSLAGRAWGAIGIEGVSPYKLKTAVTAYISDARHYAIKVTATYEMLLTQRLILEPEVELNGYTRPDVPMQVSSGWSQCDAGLRLRYEIRRKFAPYLGASYTSSGTGAGVREDLWRVTAGLRAWL
jgi:copper resistance protein B